jgi:hypothetical protein
MVESWPGVTDGVPVKPPISLLRIYLSRLRS